MKMMSATAVHAIMPMVGSSTTVIPATRKVRKNDVRSNLKIFAYRSNSTIQIAMFTRIAATTGIGRSLNAEKQSQAIAVVNTAMRNALVRCVAPDLAFSAVRTSTAVAGSPPMIPEATFAIQSPKTSLSRSKSSFRIFAAIFAEIIVSSTAMTAMTAAVFAMRWYVQRFAITSASDGIFGMEKSWKASEGNFVPMVCIQAPAIISDSQNDQRIARTVRGIGPGTDGTSRFQICRKANADTKIPNAAQLVSPICDKVWRRFATTVGWEVFIAMPSAAFNWEAAMVIQTPRRNPCNAAHGMSVMYRESLSAQMAMTAIPVAMAKCGTYCEPDWRTKAKIIPDNAPAGP